MIETNTVFIIGAGANTPYGYPTGAGLRKRIIENLESLITQPHYGPESQVNGLMLFQKAKEFITVFDNSGITSIDRFLSLSPEYGVIGKIAIILTLLDYEANSCFRERSKTVDDWYTFLFNRMISEFDGPESLIRFKENKVTFITFNYDRSLEHFLHMALSNAVKSATPEEIKAQIQGIEIYHVYGKICPLPWEVNDNSSLSYLDNSQAVGLSRLHLDYIASIRSNIKLIQERNKLDHAFVAESIRQAERIFFLGFGYAPENNKALGLEENLTKEHHVRGTALGQTENQISKIRNFLINIQNLRTDSSRNKIENKTCLTLLKDYL